MRTLKLEKSLAHSKSSPTSWSTSSKSARAASVAFHFFVIAVLLLLVSLRCFLLLAFCCRLIVSIVFYRCGFRILVEFRTFVRSFVAADDRCGWSFRHATCRLCCSAIVGPCVTLLGRSCACVRLMNNRPRVFAHRPCLPWKSERQGMRDQEAQRSGDVGGGARGDAKRSENHEVTLRSLSACGGVVDCLNV